jgi:hypothetical protein
MPSRRGKTATRIGSKGRNDRLTSSAQDIKWNESPFHPLK